MPEQENNISANKRIARNSIFLSIRMLLVLCIALYTTRAVLQMLGVEDYGVYNVVCGFVSMFAFLNTSLSNGIQRFYNFELGRSGVEGAKRVYNTSVIIQLLLALCIIVLTESLGLWYLHHKMVIPEMRMVAAQYIFHFSVLSFLFVILQAPYMAAVMAHERMDFFALVSIVDAALKLGAVYIAPCFNSDNLIAYGVLISSISVFDFICYLVYSKLHFEEIEFEKSFDSSMFKNMLSFSGWNLFGSFSGIMKEQGINLVLNLFYGPVVNAARGVAVQVNSGLQGFVSTITTPVRPQVIQSYAQGNIDRTMNLTYSISKLSCMFLYMMALPVMCEINFILNLWLGDNIPSHTNTFVMIVILTSFLNNLNGAVSGVVHASGKMKTYQITTSVIALLCVPIAYFALKLGAIPEWALWAVFITMVFAQITALLVLKTIITFNLIDYIKKVIVPILLVICSTFWVPLCINAIVDAGWLRFIANTLVSVIVIAVSTILVGLNSNERELLFKMIKSKFRK